MLKALTPWQMQTIETELMIADVRRHREAFAKPVPQVRGDKEAVAQERLLKAARALENAAARALRWTQRTPRRGKSATADN